MSKISKWLRKNGVFGLRMKVPSFTTVGPYTYGVIGDSVWMASEDAPLQVGSYCSVASGVQFYCKSGHVHDCATSFPIHFCVLGQPMPNKSLGHRRGIRVGNDVWIGRDAAIMPGVTIGDGAVIGARAVVAKDVPPYAVSVGNPARVVRYRFDDETIAKLLSIQWWAWDTDKVKLEADYLTGPIEDFVARHFQADQSQDAPTSTLA